MSDRTPRRIVVIACWLLLVAAPAARAEDEANGPFQGGLAAVHEQRWEEAIDLFRKSLKLRQHSLTLYMLAVCSAERMNAQDALDYAVRALETRPPLEERYDRHARALLMWAAEVLLLPPRVRAKYAMNTDDEPPTHDLLTESASAEDDELERESKEVRDKVGPYIDLDQLELELRILEATDPCTAPGLPSELNRCLESIFKEETSLPEPPEPVAPDAGASLPPVDLLPAASRRPVGSGAGASSTP
jgi:tetratricopeptide (TPR) repeat protein